MKPSPTLCIVGKDFLSEALPSSVPLMKSADRLRLPLRHLWRAKILQVTDGMRARKSGSQLTCMGLFLSSGCFGLC